MKNKVLFALAIMAIAFTGKTQEKYAVLITGDMAAKNIPTEIQWNGGKDNPNLAFWNDTYLMWELLLEKGYTAENIIVLFGDGYDYQPTWIAPRYTPQRLGYDFVTDYSATRANVDMVFNGLANGNNGFAKLTEDDFLAVWVFDHGWWNENPADPKAYICLLGNDKIWDYELAALTNQINCNKKVFMMQQCSSGGFINDLENGNTIVSTAVTIEYSATAVDDQFWDDIDYFHDPDPGTHYSSEEIEFWANKAVDSLAPDGNSYIHGEYNLHLFNALRGKTPKNTTVYETEEDNEQPGPSFPLSDADLLQDGIVSLYEVQQWEKHYNSRQAGCFVCNDNPQYSDIGNIGKTTSLEFPTILNNEITGITTIRGITVIPIDFQVNSGETFTIEGNSRVYLINNSNH